MGSPRRVNMRTNFKDLGTWRRRYRWERPHQRCEYRIDMQAITNELIWKTITPLLNAPKTKAAKVVSTPKVKINNKEGSPSPKSSFPLIVQKPWLFRITNLWLKWSANRDWDRKIILMSEGVLRSRKLGKVRRNAVEETQKASFLSRRCWSSGLKSCDRLKTESKRTQLAPRKTVPYR